MPGYLYHSDPDTLVFETGNRRQPSGRGRARAFLAPSRRRRPGLRPGDPASMPAATPASPAVAVEDGRWWHLLDSEDQLDGRVEVGIDAEHRSLVSQLHTDSHILNAFVFRRFEGALVTGAQINADGTGRMDFDLPDFDNDKLRGLEEEINAAIRAGLPVETRYVPFDEAARRRA